MILSNIRCFLGEKHGAVRDNKLRGGKRVLVNIEDKLLFWKEGVVCMDEIQTSIYASLITEQCPDLGARSFEPIGEGHRNAAILVNGEWIFRFPKSIQGALELNKEIRLLPLLADRIRTAIPKFAYIGTGSEGHAFVGYRKVPGEILGEDRLESLDEEARGRLAGGLAGFMQDMGGFPVPTAILKGVPVRDHVQETAELKSKAENRVFPLLQESLRVELGARFQAYLDHPLYTRYTPALIHGDLSPDHWLTDATWTSLTGIIDFGDAAVGDPDYDYLYVLEDCGETFTRQVMGHRDVRDPDALMEKISLFVLFDQVGYLLEALEADERDWIAEATDLVKAALS